KSAHSSRLASLEILSSITNASCRRCPKVINFALFPPTIRAF
ncbi:MAG: hypothetical protein ACI9FG_001103, partial [Crocinitomicaceae bacterium]